MKWSDLRIRIIILVIIGVLSPGALIFVYQGPVWPVNTGRSFPPVGVSFFWERDAVNVRVDDREERVPRDQVATSTLYQQAIDRLPSDARIGATGSSLEPRFLLLVSAHDFDVVDTLSVLAASEPVLGGSSSFVSRRV